jgi:hypothetical protein
MCSAMPASGAPTSGRTSGSWTMGSTLSQARQGASLVSLSISENCAVGSLWAVASLGWSPKDCEDQLEWLALSLQPHV